MNLREQILQEHSKKNAVYIANWIGNDTNRVAMLIDLFLNDEYRVVQRAAYAVSKVADRNPELLATHLEPMVAKMKESGLHIAVKRNIIRLLQDIVLPEHLHGDIMNICFDYLADINEPIAVRVFSMSVLDKLSQQYPEIKQELHVIIKDELERGASAGFMSRANKILHKK